MSHFLVSPGQIADGMIRITGNDVNHIKNVLRMRKGDPVTIGDGSQWEYTCAVESVKDDEIICRIMDAQKPGRELASGICLMQCLAKGDKMDFVIQKAVELGASEILPVSSARCVMKLDPKKTEAKVRRWNLIAEGAAKQSMRMVVPEVLSPLSFSESLAFARKYDRKLIPYEKAEGIGKTRELVGSIRPGESVAVLIGPEGGFEDSEVRQAIESGFETITLGKRILRTETAAVAALSVLMFHLEQE